MRAAASAVAVKNEPPVSAAVLPKRFQLASGKLDNENDNDKTEPAKIERQPVGPDRVYARLSALQMARVAPKRPSKIALPLLLPLLPELPLWLA